MRIVVSGSSGLVGSALVPALGAAGHEVVRLVRRPPGDGEIRWDPAAGRLDAAALEGADAVVHLAGASIAGRWSEQRKRQILGSRVDSTRLLAEALLGLEDPPATFVGASAIGFYGDRGDGLMDEDQSPGEGFLAEVCRRWEAAAGPLQQRLRVAHLRIGVALSGRGGALKQMLTPFRLGLGGVIGPGTQYMSWVALDDLVAAFIFVLEHDTFAGPVNVVAPGAVTNRAFTRTLGRVLGRPTFVPMPAVVVRTLFGEMGKELLLASTRVAPHRLLNAGFSFRFPELEGALSHELEVRGAVEK